jgi:hypothetical protein
VTRDWAEVLTLFPGISIVASLALLASAPAAAAERLDGAHAAGALSAPDGAGGQFIAANDLRDGTSDIYLFRVGNDGLLFPGWPAQGTPVITAPGGQFVSQVLADGFGGVIVVWTDSRGSLLDSDIYAQRLDASGTPLWPPDGVLLIVGSDRYGNSVTASDGAGGLLVAWESGYQDPNILALRVTSAGDIAPGWDPGGVVVCGHTGHQDQPAIAPDGTGGAYVSWIDERDSVYDPELFMQRVSAGGVPQWAADGIPIDPGFARDDRALLVPVEGDVFVFWSTDDTARGQRLNADGESLWPAAGVPLGGKASHADIYISSAMEDGDGGAIVLWLAYPGMEYALDAQRVDGSGTLLWGPAGVRLVSVPDQVFGTSVCPDGRGGAFLSLVRVHMFGFLNYRDLFAQHVTGAGIVDWLEDGVPVSTAPGDQYGATVAPDGNDGLVVSFEDPSRHGPMIRSQHFNAAGVAQLPVNGAVVYDNPGTQTSPLLLHLANGAVLSVWAEKRFGNYDVRARTLDTNGNPGSATTLLATGPGDQFPSALVDDGAGGAMVIWTDASSEREQDLRAQRIDGNAVPQWTAGGVAVSVMPGPLGPFVAAISDGAGGAIIAWDDRHHELSDVGFPVRLAQRISAGGVALWSANGIKVSDSFGYPENPQIAPDGAGGAIFAWSDPFAPLPRILAQQIVASGLPQWAPGGVEIASFSPSSSAWVSGVVPGSGSSVIVLIQYWHPNPGASPYQLFVQNVDAAGGAVWGPSGALAGNLGEYVSNAQIVDDGNGGARIAWNDLRSGTTDLFAQSVNSAGAAQWGVDGKVICDAPGYQDLGVITHSGADLIVTWTDYRGGDANIYAQRLGADGTALWTANGHPVAIEGNGQYDATVAPYRSGTSERFLIGWCDNRLGTDRQATVQSIDGAGAPQWDDGVTDVAVSLVGASADGGRVRISWLAAAGASATVYRRAEGDALWASLGHVTANGTGRVSFEDRDVAPGVRYGYRIGVMNDGAEVFSAEAWVDVPAAVLALERVAVGDGHRASVTFTLPRAGPTSLEVLDISGRRVGGRELEGLGAGAHTTEVEGPRASGVYFVRLRQGTATVTRRVALVR